MFMCIQKIRIKKIVMIVDRSNDKVGRVNILTTMAIPSKSFSTIVISVVVTFVV